jgi:SOS-response transcriptional repressor LexA
VTGLTDRQASVLLYIRESIAERGYPPTLREIGARMGIKSTNGVNDHLRALERKGYLRREDMKSRGMRIISDAPEAATAEATAATARDAIAARGDADHIAGLLRGILDAYQIIAVRRKDGRVVVDLAGEIARRLRDGAGDA